MDFSFLPSELSPCYLSVYISVFVSSSPFSQIKFKRTQLRAVIHKRWQLLLALEDGESGENGKRRQAAKDFF